MSATACNSDAQWLPTLFCFLLFTAGPKAAGAVSTNDSEASGPAFVLSDGPATTVWWAVFPYVSSSPQGPLITDPAISVADGNPTNGKNVSQYLKYFCGRLDQVSGSEEFLVNSTLQLTITLC